MKRLLIQLAVVSAIVIVAWWPLAEREMQGPWLVSHILIPVSIACLALLVFRILRSLIVAGICALLAAALVVVMVRHFGDQIMPLLEKVFR